MLEPIHVLLAEDDVDDRKFFEEALAATATPAKLITAENGEKLMNALSEFDTPPPPSIIFLDINMPRKNGKECLREIRSNQKFENVPVIMFSTSTHPQDIEETYANGANLYLSKQLFFKDDVNILKKILALNSSQELTKIPKEKFIFK